MTEEEFVDKKTTLTSSEALSLPMKWHDEFEEKWTDYIRAKSEWGSVKEAHSFHNRHHIEAVLEAHAKYLENITDVDPLDLIAGIKKWNKENQLHSFDTNDLSDFNTAMGWAIRCHDLGNIMDKIEVIDGKLVPHYREQYVSRGAEKVSSDVVGLLIDSTDLDADKKNRYTALARHIIEGTIFSADPKEGLQNYVEILDQVGNDFFNKDENRRLGLVMELTAENPDFTFQEEPFFNFARVRIPVLIPDEVAQKELITIWGGLPNHNPVSRNGSVLGVSYIKEAVN